MFEKILESMRLYVGNLPLIAALVFTVYLPLNLATNYYVYFANPQMDEIAIVRMNMWTEAIFSPLVLAAVIHALNCIMCTRQASYFEALTAGFKNWLPLFLTNLVAGILVGIGLVALIVPGIVLSVRYAFLHCAVVVDGKRRAYARNRSWALTKGLSWQILVIGVAYVGVLGVLSVVGSLLVQFMERTDAQFVVQMAMDCLFELIVTYFATLIFVLYWHAKAALEPVALALEPSRSITENSSLPPIVDDGNPYRPPQSS